MSYRVGVWAAVSSLPQAAADKQSLPSQLADGHAFAEGIGGQVVRTYQIPGHSRAYVLWSDAERAMPQYRELREDLERGALDILWCYDTDRLGRTTALVQQVLALCEQYNCECYISTAPHVLGQRSAAQRLVASVKGVFAEEDQALRVRRFRSGMRGRVKRGLIANHPPMGYAPVRDGDTGKVIGYEFDEHAPAVRAVTDLFLRGHSLLAIVAKMNESPHRPPRAPYWHLSVVHRIVHNDTYAGRPYWGTAQAPEPMAAYPPIWDEPTYARVIRERERRARLGFRRHGTGPFRNVAFCARCGHPLMRAVWTGKGHRYVYLRCATHRRRKRTGTACHFNNIAEPKVAAAVASFVAELTDPEVIDAALAELGTSADEARLRAELERAERAATDLGAQRQRLALAYAAGQMDVEIYRQADDALSARLDRERQAAEQARAVLVALPDSEMRRDALLALAGDFGAFTLSAEPAEVATMLQEAGLRVEVEDGEVVRVALV